MAPPVEGLCTAAQAIMGRVAPVTDFVIVSADGDEFPVSKGLMAAASVVLADMFANLKEGSRKRSADAVDGRTTLEETSSEVILLLNHAYAGSEFHMDPDDIGSSLQLARKYDMPRVLKACLDYLDNVRLSVKNLPAWLAAAPDCEVPLFTERCMKYAAGHLESIIR